MAKLYFRYGAMNCGKSTALMQVAHNYRERGMAAWIVKPFSDTKGGDRVVSRLGIERRVDLLIRSEDDVFDCLIDRESSQGRPDCILVDEAQFFTREQIDQFFAYAVKHDVPVICYGLRTDFIMNGFPGATRLLEIAHSVEELKTICRCGRKAILNGRKIDGHFVFEGDQVSIDGENSVEYESLCPVCYFAIREGRA